MALHLSTLHVKKEQRTESNKKHNLIYLLTKTKSVSKTAQTNNSNLNKAHDIWIRTYKQAATAATTNKPKNHQGQKKINESERERVVATDESGLLSSPFVKLFLHAAM